MFPRYCPLTFKMITGISVFTHITESASYHDGWLRYQPIKHDIVLSDVSVYSLIKYRSRGSKELPPWSRTSERLLVAQLVKKFHHFVNFLCLYDVTGVA